MANGGLTLIALPGKGRISSAPLGATSDGSELSHGLTRRYLTTTNGEVRRIPPCLTNRQGIELTGSDAGHPVALLELTTDI